MISAPNLDQVYNFIMRTFVEQGRAPHHTDIAKAFSLPPDSGKDLLHELMDNTKLPIWLYPDTDLIASFAPFDNLPTPYRITIGGEQKWFAQ
jgi:hypothetical protein